jgi:hypothetical protein
VAPREARPELGARVSRSTVDDTRTVIEHPKVLLAQARRFDAELSLDEYAAARLAASEHGSGSFEELCAIIDAELNRSRWNDQSLFASLTWHGTFGKQGGRRRASTRLDPHERHVEAARAVLRSGERRGISQGAVRFFDPRTQLALFRAGKACDPLVVLERWSFDYPWLGKPCRLNRRRPGRELQEWVGNIPGVDAMSLLLMRPAESGVEHQARFEAARDLIRERLYGERTVA